MTTREPLLRLYDARSTPAESVRSFLDANAGGSTIEFTTSGTAALYRGAISQFGPDVSGTVLLPAYICDVAVPPFRRAGLDVAFYRVSREAEIDLGDLESKLTDDAVAAMSVDFFGFPARGFEALDRLCTRDGLVHVEDNAHSVLSRADGPLLGTRTGFGIASLPKLLPVPDGGVLYTSPSNATDPAPIPWGETTTQNAETITPARDTATTVPFLTAEPSDLDFLLRTAIKWVDLELFDGRAVRGINERWGEPCGTDGFEVGSASPLTETLLKRIDAAEVIRRRRRNYRALADLFDRDPDVDPLYPGLPGGVCPQVFPVVVEDPPQFERRLRSANLPVHRWPRLPPEVRGNEAFPAANYLAEHVFTLPVHQACDLNELIRKVQAVAARAV